MRHSWIKIVGSRKQCTACGMIAHTTTAEDGYNKIVYYYNRRGEKLTKRGTCKFFNQEEE